MPYIESSQRTFAKLAPQTAGELNYTLTEEVQDYIKRAGGLNYQNLNEVIGVLECVKLELYRRVAAPYEDQKCHDNGDVYYVR